MKSGILAICFLAMPLLAEAQFTGPGAGTSSDNRQAVVTTVAAANKAPLDTPVRLEGQIQRQVARERYLFGDATGTIAVEIDDDDLPRESFNETTTLRIEGEVDRSRSRRQRYIDVDSVQIVR